VQHVYGLPPLTAGILTGSISVRPASPLCMPCKLLILDTEPGFPDGHEVLAEVIKCTSAVDPPAYTTIINLDMRLRETRASDGRGQDAAELGQYPAISVGTCSPSSTASRS
jgi:hypothetical protein